MLLDREDWAPDMSRAEWIARNETMYRRRLRRTKLYRRCGTGRDRNTRGYFRDKARTHLELAKWHLLAKLEAELDLMKRPPSNR